jgi:hypothetical protein
MWKKAVVAQFNVLYGHLSGDTEENHENLSLYSRSPGVINPNSN